MVQGLGKEIPHGFLRSAAAHVLLQGALQQAGRAGVLPGPARGARRPQQAAHVQAAPVPRLNVGAQLQRNLNQEFSQPERCTPPTGGCCLDDEGVRGWCPV